MVSIHTTQPCLAYKLTTIRLASRDTTLRAGLTIKLIMERYHAYYHSRHIYKYSWTASIINSTITLIACDAHSCLLQLLDPTVLIALHETTYRVNHKLSMGSSGNNRWLHTHSYQLRKPEKTHTVNANICISIISTSICNLYFMLIIYQRWHTRERTYMLHY